MDNISGKKAWLITVDMGYGHQRPADALRPIAFDNEVICADTYQGIPEKDRRLWRSSRKFYEAISAFKTVPIIGPIAFSLFDFFQRVAPFYPKKESFESTFTLKQIYYLLKKGWGKHLIKELEARNQKLGVNLPIVSTFFTPVFMADYFNYPGEIFCVICDTDISRSWAPLDPRRSRIKYFAPTQRAKARLESYGIRPENVFLTGFPLPLENIGDESMTIIKNDLKSRLQRLDPQKKFLTKYQSLVAEKLGEFSPAGGQGPITLVFAVGGAGAQKELAVAAMKSLKDKIKEGKIQMVLTAGIRQEIKEYFENEMHKIGLAKEVNQGVEVLFSITKSEYFQKFNNLLRHADILWTKPSELSFFANLGLPIIIAPTIGSHEEFNKRWLINSGFGIEQKEPAAVDEWLFDFINEGYLAESAFEGFLEGEKLGVLNIKKIVEKCSG